MKKLSNDIVHSSVNLVQKGYSYSEISFKLAISKVLIAKIKRTSLWIFLCPKWEHQRRSHQAPLGVCDRYHRYLSVNRMSTTKFLDWKKFFSLNGQSIYIKMDI